MILNRVKPHMYLPLLGVLWGIVATCMGAAQNHTHLIVLRFLLGLFEAGFAPGCTFYLSSWYVLKRDAADDLD
jgi:MFS family permease